MINQTEPYLTKDEVMDDQAITACVAAAGHPHISVMGSHYHSLLEMHAVMHLVGAEDSPPHAEVIDKLDRLERDIDRGLKAVWS